MVTATVASKSRPDHHQVVGHRQLVDHHHLMNGNLFDHHVMMEMDPHQVVDHRQVDHRPPQQRTLMVHSHARCAGMGWAARVFQWRRSLSSCAMLCW